MSRSETLHPAMTCVGLLELQHRGVAGNDPTLIEARAYSSAHPPDKAFLRDVFYWYFGSQVVHNFGELEWQVWHRRLRHDLLDSQEKSGCAAGSWYLGQTAPEVWSAHAGRLLTTSLACATVGQRQPATIGLEQRVRHRLAPTASQPAMQR